MRRTKHYLRSYMGSHMLDVCTFDDSTLRKRHIARAVDGSITEAEARDIVAEWNRMAEGTRWCYGLSEEHVYEDPIATRAEKAREVHPLILAEAVRLGAEFAALYTGNGARYRFPYWVKNANGDVDPELVTAYLRKVASEAGA